MAKKRFLKNVRRGEDWRSLAQDGLPNVRSPK